VDDLPTEPIDSATSARRCQPPRCRALVPHHQDGFRRFLHSATIFLIAVLTLRAVVIEPFGVPTGSMALTLAGNHKACQCPDCGFPIRVGQNSGDSKSPSSSVTTCPNCGAIVDLRSATEVIGDRLLVDKNIFELRTPRRWEVAVFRNPSDLTKPYVKRVVGLPNERIQIRGGDVYINGNLLRKTLRELQPMRIPVFDTAYPLTNGNLERHWVCDAHVECPQPALCWSGDDQDPAKWVHFRNWDSATKSERPITDWFAYNGGGYRHEPSDVFDFSASFAFRHQGGNGALEFRLRDGVDEFEIVMPATGAIYGRRGKETYLGSDIALKPDRVYLVDAALVDRRVTVAIDGVVKLGPLNLNEPRYGRRPVSRPISFRAAGLRAEIQRLTLYRDLHYTSSGRNAIYEPWQLGPNEYFMLGDNSANSEDSRFWSIPGVPEHMFLGKPLLLHQPSRRGVFGTRELQVIDWNRVGLIR
jgi:signal peptidase I